MFAIEVDNLCKSYGNLQALKGVSFKVTEGDFFALLGTNGAGKSTTINILSTILAYDSGTAKLFGMDVKTDYVKIKNLIGIVFQNSVLDNLLTVKENLETRGVLYGKSKQEIAERINYLTEKLDLKDFLNRRVGKLSGGQKRRADIARALIHNPKLLFLDEPTTGLDPQTRIMVWKVLNEIQAENNMTILLTTHYMEEANNADSVVIIDDGMVVADGTPYMLKEKFSSDVLNLYPNNAKNMLEILKQKNLKYKKNAGCYTLQINTSMDAINLISELKPTLKDFEVIKGNMDSVFLKVTGKVLGGRHEQ